MPPPFFLKLPVGNVTTVLELGTSWHRPARRRALAEVAAEASKEDDGPKKSAELVWEAIRLANLMGGGNGQKSAKVRVPLYLLLQR